MRKPVIKISTLRRLWEKATSVAMTLLLLLLTGINYLIYAPAEPDDLIGEVESTASFPGSPAGPDEKSPNGPVSINEEYVHDHENPVNPFWANALFEHMIHEADKLCFVHFELISPPPEA